MALVGLERDVRQQTVGTKENRGTKRKKGGGGLLRASCSLVSGLAFKYAVKIKSALLLTECFVGVIQKKTFLVSWCLGGKKTNTIII